MANIRQFEDIEAWKKGRELAGGVYAVTAKGEFARDYGLKDQIQRAAVSIMANIVHPVKYMRWTISRGRAFPGRQIKNLYNSCISFTP